MKNSFRLFFLLFLGICSCKDKCTETRIVVQEIPIPHPLSELRNLLKVLPAQEVHNPGKIVAHDAYLFINDIKTGVHVVDNSDPSNPKPVAFIQIPGNGDIVVKDNILYADSYMDIVMLDITDPEHAREVGRRNEVFTQGWFNGETWYLSDGGVFLNDYKKTYTTQTVSVDCEDNAVAPTIVLDYANTNFEMLKALTRFGIRDNILFGVNAPKLTAYDISNPVVPNEVSNIPAESFVLSLFVNQNRLFLSSYYGTQVYDCANPAVLQKQAILSGSAADKAVVHNNLVYVTQRTGTMFGAIIALSNKLDVIDITDGENPKTIRTYPMGSPNGIALDFPVLYVCEGMNGFKIFDVTDPLKFDEHLLFENGALHANDVVVDGKRLIVIADDGIYQLDASDPKAPKQLSKMPVIKSN